MEIKREAFAVSVVFPLQQRTYQFSRCNPGIAGGKAFHVAVYHNLALRFPQRVSSGRTVAECVTSSDLALAPEDIRRLEQELAKVAPSCGTVP